MTSGIAVLLLLLGHVLADFYLQSERVAKAKRNSKKSLAIHCVLYALWILLFALAIFPWGTLLYAWLLVAGTHALLDIAKLVFEKRGRNPLACFGVDQIGHVLFCIITVFVFSGGTPAIPLIAELEGLIGFETTMNYLVMAVALLTSCRPIRILISGILALLRLGDEDAGMSAQESNTPNAGRWIGIFERIIVVILTLNAQFSAIAFIFAAKSIARFKKLEDDQRFAECYLVGTLTSVASAIAISLFVQSIALWQ